MLAIIVEILATIIDTMMLIWFIPKFVGIPLKNKLWTLVIPVLQLLVQLMFDWLMPGFSLLPMIIMFFIVLAFSVALSPKTIWWDVLSAIAYISLMMLVSSFLFSAFSFFIENMAEILQGTDSKARILYIAIAKLMLFVSYKLILLLFKKEKNIQIPNAIMTVILTIATVIGLSAIMKIVAVIDTGIIDGPILVIALVMVVVNIVLYLFIRQFVDYLYKNTINESKITAANEIIENQILQYKSMLEHNNYVAKMQHDNKHLFLGLLSEMKNGNYDAVMKGLSDACQVCERDLSSNNSIIDAVVNVKKKSAESRGIQLVSDIRNTDGIVISPMDIAIVLGNALDNAIEACETLGSEASRFLRLFIILKGNNLMISIKNPVNENVDVNNLTSTKSGDLHGFGIISMKQIADKYDGEVFFECEDNVFTTTIYMVNR